MTRPILAAIFLAACVPTVDRADCTDGAQWVAGTGGKHGDRKGGAK